VVAGAATGSGVVVGITMVGVTGAGVTTGAAATGASVTGIVTSCAWAVPAESSSMAEIAMVLRGDMALILVMTRKRDDLCNRFHIGDEASAYCQ
jgi:hypothetical protein